MHLSPVFSTHLFNTATNDNCFFYRLDVFISLKGGFTSLDSNCGTLISHDGYPDSPYPPDTNRQWLITVQPGAVSMNSHKFVLSGGGLIMQKLDTKAAP